MPSQLQLLATGYTDPLPKYGVRHNSSVSEEARSAIEDNRPSAEYRYKPSNWSHEYIQSLKINQPDEACIEKVKLLEESVRIQLISVEDDAVDGGQLQKLELIDSITKLGLGYRFQADINGALEALHLLQNSVCRREDDLYATALRFRLARQNGLQTSQDVFKCYLEKNGRFDPALSDNVQGILALYEASNLGCDGEENLEEARGFSTLHLKKHLNGNICKRLANQIRHALEVPLHRRVQRLDARWYIQEHYNEKYIALLELARLDYNLVQTVQQGDLQEMSRWWKEMGLSEKLSFARDRLMECFFWATSMVSEPQLRNCRKGLTKIGILITVLDDVYDMYGSLDELELFTHAVQRWDLDCISDLPEIMKHCFLALYDTINQIACSILKEKGVNVIQLLAKAWADLCSAFLVEARWFHGKQMPSFDEYLNNGCLSSSGPLILMHAYCLSQPINTKALESFQDLKDFMLWPSMIFRFSNDLATYSAELARGEKSASSVLCYMHETGVSEPKACARVRDLVEKSWKKMNSLLMSEEEDPVITKSFIDTVMNLARVVHCVYQHGDGHGGPGKRSKDQIMSLIINPISLQQVPY